ncbi:PD-(D/E)XK nuclease family protein [Ichthyobacterium seriolicida]|uniref:PD-(D/E)XK endonuclease-like domain-containing protein n=1 Tax=Ichthyobacterium seriolicida TaxID=242600 RepID=A0A1J1ECZ8_9FLAO|nr:PD-(D/E)XK nuclease family protein [Ichthyobacterium seriolicida]BAV95392.1 hypothetical protein JBKA6_1379 [Ichthyobacterium seriolicida]
MTFLQRVCKDLIYNKKFDFSNTEIVVPNDRAIVFLNKIFKEEFRGKESWLPKIISMKNFIMGFSDCSIYNRNQLLMELFKSCRETGLQNHSITDFFTWGDIALRDFNDIDLSMSNAQEVLESAKNIVDVEQSDLEEKAKKSISEYCAFIENMKFYYNQFNKNLDSKKASYNGKCFRFVAENIEAIVENIKLKTPDRHFVFVGLNALNKAERKIVKVFCENKMSEMYWHCDSYYISDKNQEAGKGIRDLQHFGTWFDYKSENFNWLDKGNFEDKKIRVISSQKNVSQCVVAADILSKMTYDEISDTAVVLADQSLLFPLLQVLPQEIKKINISLGIPLRSTPLACFFEQLFDLIVNYNKFCKRFYHSDLNKLWLNPMSKIIWKDCFKWSLEIRKSNRVYLGKDDYSLFEDFINHIDIENKKGAISWILYFKELIEILRDKYLSSSNQVVGRAREDKITLEYLFHFHKLMVQLENNLNTYSDILCTQKQIDSIELMRDLYNNQLYKESVSIKGESLEGLQIMGIFETSTLCFKNLIMLSVNDDVLPNTDKQNSFIPLYIRRELGIPTYLDEDAKYAYHFYRLLQGCENATLIYNSLTDDYSSGQESRFIMQLENESALNIIREHYSPENHKKATRVRINKTQEDIIRIREIFSGKAKYPDSEKSIKLSPSVINTYRICPVKFYYNYVLNIRDYDEVEANIKPNVFGCFLHEILEGLYRPYLNCNITPDIIDLFKRKIDDKVEYYFSQENANNKTNSEVGYNYLSKQVAKALLLKFLEKEKKMIGEGLILRDVEKPISRNLKLSDGTEVLISGTIDRIDEQDGFTRIIDYKTGVFNKLELKFTDFSDFIDSPQKTDKLFQLLSYAYMYSSNSSKVEEKSNLLRSGIIGFNNINEWFKGVQFNSDETISTELMSDFEEELCRILQEMLDINIPFEHLENADNCFFCKQFL